MDTHETVEATNLGESLGVRVDGLAGHTGPTVEKDSRLDAVLEGLERRPWISGEQLRVVVGHMTIRALLDRNLLSILNHVYTFIEVCMEKKVVLWESVAREITLFRALMPLGIARLRRVWGSGGLMTDACPSGYAVMAGGPF